MPSPKVLVVSPCTALVDSQCLQVNRKFHTGMLAYAATLGHAVACLLVRARDGSVGLDPVIAGLSTLPYEVHLASSRAPANADRALLEAAVANAPLVYSGLSTPLDQEVFRIAHARGIPFVAIAELTLQTRLDILKAELRSGPRRWVRTWRTRSSHRAEMRIAKLATEIHANGYPAFSEMSEINTNVVLFLDTRMEQDDLIPSSLLERRLARLDGNVAACPKLVYTGRYDAIKGVSDVVATALSLRDRGVRFALECFGDGPLKESLRTTVRRAGAEETIRINDPLPFRPELINTVRDADLFLCCHPQGDPSCTYLETLAAGVPICGYDNEMWRPLCAASGAGWVSPTGDIEALASTAQDALAHPAKLRAASLAALAFAKAHTFESAWKTRTDRLRTLLASHV